MGVENYVINDDYSIDVHKNEVNLNYKNLTEFPDYIKFNRILNGYFSCKHNLLTSLRGCPKYTTGDFNCANNLLSSLEGCPIEVYNSFICYGNRLTFGNEYIRKLCAVKQSIIN
jgi:hypothetical protein